MCAAGSAHICMRDWLGACALYRHQLNSKWMESKRFASSFSASIIHSLMSSFKRTAIYLMWSCACLLACLYEQSFSHRSNGFISYYFIFLIVTLPPRKLLCVLLWNSSFVKRMESKLAVSERMSMYVDWQIQCGKSFTKYSGKCMNTYDQTMNSTRKSGAWCDLRQLLLQINCHFVEHTLQKLPAKMTINVLLISKLLFHL